MTSSIISQVFFWEMEYSDVGRLLEEPVSRKEVLWEIDGFYRIAQDMDFILQSSAFSFAGASWRLTMLLDNNENRDVLLSLKRVSYGSFGQMVYCQLGIHTVDDSLSGENGIGALNFDKPNGGCFINLYPRRVLDSKRHVIAPEGTLRAFCKLQIESESTAVASTQTEIVLIRHNTLSQDMEKLLLSGDDSDVTIRVKGKDFRAHRGILGARTPVFASMFKSNMVEKSSGVVTIDDCEADHFEDFLYLIYTGNPKPLSHQKAIGLYTLADKYDVADIRPDCLKWFRNNLSQETLFDVVSLAVKHDETELLELAIRFFCQNIKKIIKTVYWQKFMTEHPTVANEMLIKAIGDQDNERYS